MKFAASFVGMFAVISGATARTIVADAERFTIDRIVSPNPVTGTAGDNAPIDAKMLDWWTRTV